jgi:CBS domain-containing protein
MNIRDLCSRDLVSATAGTPLLKVARLMRDEHVGIVVITESPADEAVAAGVITDRDVAMTVLERAGGVAELRAGDVMRRDPLVLCEDDSFETGINRLLERGVRRAPVVTRSGRLTGMVSTDDLFAHVAEELAGLTRLLARQPGQERFSARRVVEPRRGTFTGAGHGI